MIDPSTKGINDPIMLFTFFYNCFRACLKNQ